MISHLKGLLHNTQPAAGRTRAGCTPTPPDTKASPATKLRTPGTPCSDKIESIGDKTHGKIRELATEGVRALTDLEGDVPSDVLRRLVSKLLKLAQRAANFVSDAEEDSVNSIKRLFPQVSDVDRRSRD